MHFGTDGGAEVEVESESNTHARQVDRYSFLHLVILSPHRDKDKTEGFCTEAPIPIFLHCRRPERLQAGGGGFIGVVKSRDLSRGAGSSSGSGRSGRRHQLHPILPSVRRHACIASKQQDYDFGRLDNFWREQQLAILHSSSSPGPLDNCRNEYIYMQGEEHVHCDLFRDIGDRKLSQPRYMRGEEHVHCDLFRHMHCIEAARL
ncbi:hypothetical protein ZWY2020_027258 [Hordeum vulgare]|nr:hypothetical protein ZWY2020_027258 [Hordeum vulgare]